MIGKDIYGSALRDVDFCASIRDGVVPRSSCEVGLDVVRMIEAVDASLADGGSRVAVGSRTTQPV